MKRRVIFEIMAVAAVSLVLGGSAIWASRSGDGEKATNSASSQQNGPGMPWFLAPTPDPYNLPEIPADWHLHWVGPHRCYLPDGATEVFTEEASRKAGRIFDDGAKRYYVTPSGNCVTYENDNREQRDWIPLALQVRLDTSNEKIHPCLISDEAVEVFTEEASPRGGRVFDDHTGREYITVDGRCAHIAAVDPPDWLSPEFEAKMRDPNHSIENWSTPYPPEALATLSAGATATVAAYEEQGQ